MDQIPGKRVPQQNWHITLRFLGHVPGTVAEQTIGALDEADLGERFPVRLGGLGAFPRPRRATVLWVAVEAPLGDLAAAAEDAAQGAGLTPEDRPFHAHVTLSRIRPQRDLTELVAAAESTRVAWQADAVTLFRSHLGPGGARYERVEQIALD